MRGVVAAAALAASLVLAGGALAGGGQGGNGAPSLKQEAARLADTAALQAAVASNLGTTTAKLKAAVKTSAIATIDAGVASKDITSDEGQALKDAVADGSLPAMRFATAAGVAKALGTTEAKLNGAWSDAVKATAKARVDQALKDGKITDQQASDMKAKIDAATFTFGQGPHGPGGPGRHGRGPGGPPPGMGAGSGSGSSATPAKATF